MLMAGGKREEALRALSQSAGRSPEARARQAGRSATARSDGVAAQPHRLSCCRRSARSAAALDDFRASVDLRERLTAADPGNTAWQTRLLPQPEQHGRGAGTMGRRQDALATFRRALAVIETLVGERCAATCNGNATVPSSSIRSAIFCSLRGDARAGAGLLSKKSRDPPKARRRRSRQHDVATRRGGEPEQDRRCAQGGQPAGGSRHRLRGRARSVTEARSPSTRSNTDWQRDVSVCYLRIGDAVVADRRRDARANFTSKALRSARSSLALDPELLPRQRDVTVVYDRLGNLLYGDMQYQAALDIYRKGLAMREKIAAVDPGNVQAQRDLLLSHNNIGARCWRSAAPRRRATPIAQALAIAEKYAAANPGEVQLQFDLVLSLYQLADVGDDPRPRLERGLAMLRNSTPRAGSMPARRAGFRCSSRRSPPCRSDAEHRRLSAPRPRLRRRRR